MDQTELLRHVIDVLEHLIEENGDKAPKLRLFRASFFEDQRRKLTGQAIRTGQ